MQLYGNLLLHDLTGERIKLAFECEPALMRVRADPAELARAVMILFRNEQKAVPNAGIVTIQTANVTLTEEEARAR